MVYYNYKSIVEMFGFSVVDCIDFYKSDHIHQYPEGTEQVYTNGTFRGDHWAKNLVLDDFDHKIVWCGIQGLVKWLFVDFWKATFFDVPKEQVIAEYQALMDQGLGPNGVGTKHIAELHDLGYLPVHIKALPEGLRVPMRVPCFTITNSEPGKFYWLTNYLETQFSSEVWKTPTVATLAREFRRLFDRYAELTGTDPSFVPWQGHDFADRGMSGIFDAAHSGLGHLMSFTGTDSVSSIRYIKSMYGPNLKQVGGSVPATEHSVMCMGGENEGEIETIRRLITKIYPTGIVSIVSDTWDFWKVITDYALQLKYVILARDGKVVFRPDSGDPVKIISGYFYARSEEEVGNPRETEFEAVLLNDKYWEIVLDDTKKGWHLGKELSGAEIDGAVESLWKIFGGTVTSEGYKLLDPHVGLIYGDSITLQRAHKILERLYFFGYASGNIVFGIGSFTYNCLTRNTFGFSVKSTAGRINGKAVAIFKKPKTDDGLKNSAQGLIRIEYDQDGELVCFDNQTEEQEKRGLLRTIFLNGVLYERETFDVIKERLWQLK